MVNDIDQLIALKFYVKSYFFSVCQYPPEWMLGGRAERERQEMRNVMALYGHGRKGAVM